MRKRVRPNPIYARRNKIRFVNIRATKDSLNQNHETNPHPVELRLVCKKAPNDTRRSKYVAAFSSPSPPRSGGLELLGKQRKESGRRQRPARAEQAGASESLGRGEVVLRAQGAKYLQSKFRAAGNVSNLDCLQPIQRPENHAAIDSLSLRLATCRWFFQQSFL